MMQVGITGATGKVGRHLVKALLDQGFTVKAMIRDTRDGKRGNTQPAVQELEGWGATTCAADFADPASLQAFCVGVDVVIHNGYWQGNELDEPIPWLENNLMGSVHLMDALKNAGGRQFIFISSSAAYGRGPLDEQDRFGQMLPVTALAASHPRNVYAAYKLAVEALVTGYKYDQGMAANVSLRPAGPLGLFGFRCYDTEGMWSQEVREALAGNETSVALPASFCCLDGYDMGLACGELIRRGQSDPALVDDVVLQANTTINGADLTRILIEVFGDVAITQRVDEQPYAYAGDVFSGTDSEETLRRHFVDLKGRL